MTIKDYKGQAPSAQPPTKKDASGKSGFKKTAIGFGVGFLSGFLAAVIFDMQYLDADNAVNNVTQPEQATPNADNGKAQSDPPKTSVAEEQSIDYQFYEELAKFKLPEPGQDTATQDETDKLLLPDETDDEVSPNRESEEETQSETPTRYILQAGTFADSQKAQAQRRKIIDLGYKETHIFQSAYDNKQYYRVWLGPYADLEKAKTVGSALKVAQIEVMLRYDLRNFNPKER